MLKKSMAKKKVKKVQGHCPKGRHEVSIRGETHHLVKDYCLQHNCTIASFVDSLCQIEEENKEEIDHKERKDEEKQEVAKESNKGTVRMLEDWQDIKW